jgi:hypothetical protein
LIDGYPVEIIKVQDNAVKTVRISQRLYDSEDEEGDGED